MSGPAERERILVVDDEVSITEMLQRALTAHGFLVDTAFDGEDALELARATPPSLILLDLMMPRMDGYGFLAHRAEDPVMRDTPVVVLTAHGGEGQVVRAINAGADDFLLKPISLTELTTRIRARLRDRTLVADLRGQRKDYELLLDLSTALASQLDVREILFLVAGRLAEMMDVGRVSFLIVSRDLQHGYVLAASEDVGAHNIRVALENYPEVLAVVRSRKPLVITDVTSHPLLADVKEALARADTRSLILFPLATGDEVLGVVFLRSRRARAELSRREELVCRIVANATAIALKNAQIVESVRGETAKVNVARIQAEHRVRFLKRYEDWWENASDGMATIDAAGRVLFLNPAGARALGRARDAVVGGVFADLVVAEDRQSFAAFSLGDPKSTEPLKPMDIRTLAENGETRIISISVNALLSDHAAAVLSFRDVTEERTLESALRKTKDFLEGLVRQSVDAIIAADAWGRVVLWNAAAERLFGYRPADATQLQLGALFPPGELAQILTLLRSEELGGRGRLGPVRREVLSKGGARVPVRMSAAILVEESVESAIFAILSDLRPQEELAARLSAAQARLEHTERQSVAAEIAGTTAHELNQPLTAMLGLAELLRRSLDADSHLQPAAQGLAREAERIAEIVRKLGRITRYEPKPYVGGVRIIDLDRSSRGPDDESR